MKSFSTQVLALFSVIALSATAYAHDPSEHAGQGEKPNCSALEGMDHGPKNMSDPVMQAMMKKCMNGIHGDAMEHDHDGQEHGAETHEQSSQHEGSDGHEH